MGAIEFVDPWYYSTVYYFFFLVIAWSTVLYYMGSNGQKIISAEDKPFQMSAFLLTLALSFFLGLRPLSQEFGDTRAYANFYTYLSEYCPWDLRTEWLWYNIQMVCKDLGMNAHEFFLFAELVYLGCMYICASILMRKNIWIAMIFFFTAFQTYTYGTNGIRNGFACSIELVALSLVSGTKPQRYFSFILMYAALSIHRSTMIPTTAALLTLYAVKDTKLALRFWLASIGISLVAGPLVEQFFVALGFDDRMTSYHMGQFSEENTQYFSSTGFRWDFLLYSSAPVAMIWYVTRFRRFSDPGYTAIANAYLLSNAFWIMVIRAAFSNRFAYLSWFIYPMVIAYPLLRMNIWKDQDRKTTIILFLYSAFTFFMFFVYYFGTTGFRGFDLYWWRD